MAKVRKAARKSGGKSVATKAKRPAAKKVARTAKTKSTTVGKRRSVKAKPRTNVKAKKRAPNAAFMKPYTSELAAIVGGSVSRGEATRKLWDYIKAHGLQESGKHGVRTIQKSPKTGALKRTEVRRAIIDVMMD
jgi:upstream activation factor subunit UAF30